MPPLRRRLPGILAAGIAALVVTAVPAAGDTTPPTTTPTTTTPTTTTPTTTTPTAPMPAPAPTPGPKRRRRPVVPLTGVHFSATRVARGSVIDLAFDLGHRAVVAVRLRGRLAARVVLTRGHHRLPFGTSHLMPGTTYTATVTATARPFRPAVVRVSFMVAG